MITHLNTPTESTDLRWYRFHFTGSWSALVFFYRCLHGFYNLDILKFIIPFTEDPNYSTRSSLENLVLKELTFPADCTAKFYSHRNIILWNSLVKNVKIYLHKPSTTSSVSNLCAWVTCCRCAACPPTWALGGAEKCYHIFFMYFFPCLVWT